MDFGGYEVLDKSLFYTLCVPPTTDEEAQRRLDAILSDRLLWFNPYRVADRVLLDCAERGRWSPFPAITQMMVFHFHDIRSIPTHSGISGYDAIFFHIGNTDLEHNFSERSLIQAMIHVISRTNVWHLINGRHLVGSNFRSLEGKDVFVSHAINCNKRTGGTRQSYRMHRLRGSDANKAATIRESMCTAKITMLEEVMQYPAHPDYLGNPTLNFDYSTPILRAIDAIRHFPSATPPTTHIIP